MKGGEKDNEDWIKDWAARSENGDGRVLLPFLCEINVFLWQDGQDLVKNLVWVGLTGQSNVILRLQNKDRHKCCDV